jgi:hypothetical protein
MRARAQHAKAQDHHRHHHPHHIGAQLTACTCGNMCGKARVQCCLRTVCRRQTHRSCCTRRASAADTRTTFSYRASATQRDVGLPTGHDWKQRMHCRCSRAPCCPAVPGAGMVRVRSLQIWEGYLQCEKEIAVSIDVSATAVLEEAHFSSSTRARHE